MMKIIRFVVILFVIVISITTIIEETPLKRYFYKKTTVIENSENVLVLVNKENLLDSKYTPGNLVKPNIPFSSNIIREEEYLNSDAAASIENLFAAAHLAGYELIATSGYRSYEAQDILYDKFVQELGKEKANLRAAKPGSSEHQTGLAIDISSASFNYQEFDHFGETKAGIWVAEHAKEFGFIIRYPENKEHITGFQYEPWHLRYVGKETAVFIQENDLTLEEYYEQKM